MEERKLRPRRGCSMHYWRCTGPDGTQIESVVLGNVLDERRRLGWRGHPVRRVDTRDLSKEALKQLKATIRRTG